MKMILMTRNAPPSVCQRGHQLLNALSIRVVRQKMTAHFFDELLVDEWTIEYVDQLVIEVAIEREFPASRAVDPLGLARREHQQRYRVGAKDLEVFGGGQPEVAQERPLRHDVDSSQAHGRNDFQVWDRRMHLDVEPPETLEVQLKRRFQAQRRGPGRRGIPPQPQEPDLPEPRTDAFDRRQQTIADFLPPPPVMTDVNDVEPFRGLAVSGQPRRGVVSVEQQRDHSTLE